MKYFLHGLLRDKSWKKYYWLDIGKFFGLFIKPNQELQAVFYFTAALRNKAKKDRQDLFFSANKINPKFHLIFGKYVQKTINIEGNKYKTFEEKQTDVNIAVELTRNVVQKHCDVSILVSADSDLLPAIRLIRELSPQHKIYCFFPPNRYSADLSNNADGCIHLNRYETRFRKSLLPRELTLTNGYVIRKPENWK